MNAFVLLMVAVATFVAGDQHKQQQHRGPASCIAGDIGDLMICQFDARQDFLKALLRISDLPEHLDQATAPIKCLKDNQCVVSSGSNNWWELIKDAKLQKFAVALHDFDASCSRNMLKTLVQEAVENLMGEIEQEVRKEPSLAGFTYGDQLTDIPFPDDSTFQSPKYAAYLNVYLAALRAARNGCPSEQSRLSALQCFREAQQSKDIGQCLAKTQTCKTPDCAQSGRIANICNVVSKAAETIAAELGGNMIPLTSAENQEDLINMLKDFATEAAKGEKNLSPDTKPYSESKAIEAWQAFKAYDGPKEELGKLLLDFLTPIVDVEAVCNSSCGDGRDHH